MWFRLWTIDNCSDTSSSSSLTANIVIHISKTSTQEAACLAPQKEGRRQDWKTKQRVRIHTLNRGHLFWFGALWEEKWNQQASPHNRTVVRNIIQSITTERDLRAPLVQLSIVLMKKLRLREGKALAWIQENYRKAETRTYASWLEISSLFV